MYSKAREPPASCREGAVLCGSVWLKLCSPEDEHAMKPAVHLSWEPTGPERRFVVDLNASFVSFFLTT